MTRAFSLSELAEKTSTTLVGDPEATISGVSGLESAQSNEASFLANERYIDAMKQSRAGVICLPRTTHLPEGKNVLLCDDPSRTFQQIAELVLAENAQPTHFSGIHPSAVIHPSAQIDPSAIIAPHVTIDAHAQIGPNVTLLSNVSIGPHVTIGENTILYPNVTIREGTVIGKRVTIQPGAVIGSCGFGFTTDEKGKHTMLKQLGNVVIEDDVGIGANTAIDRARFHSTVIAKGTQIDNLVQIAHNVTIDEDSVVVAQTGIAGSTKIGKRVFIGGQAGLVGHIEVCDGAMIASKGGVSKSLTKPGLYRGEPVEPIAEYSKKKVHLRRIAKYAEKIAELEKRLQKLEENE